MSFISRLNEKYKVKVFTSNYFEMKYLKQGETLYVCFIALNQKIAKERAKSILRNFGGDKIISIKSVDSKNFHKNLTWNS